MAPVKQRAAGRCGLGDLPRQHQAASPFGEQAVAAGICLGISPSRPSEKIRCDIR